MFSIWLRERDLNPRPLGYEPNELPDCSTPRHIKSYLLKDVGWGKRIRTSECLDQNQVPYRLAIPQCKKPLEVGRYYNDFVEVCQAVSV